MMAKGDYWWLRVAYLSPVRNGVSIEGSQVARPTNDGLHQSPTLVLRKHDTEKAEIIPMDDAGQLEVSSTLQYR
jgi:hypothetical protein